VKSYYISNNQKEESQKEQESDNIHKIETTNSFSCAEK